MISIDKTQLHTTVGFLDPAGGKRGEKVKSQRARSAIVIISADHMNRIFVRDIWAERCSVADIRAAVYRLNNKWKPNQFGIEGSAQQSLFADAMILDAVEKHEQINIINVVHPTTITKEFRIRTHVQPLMPDGRLFMKADQGELKDELITFPMSDPVDLLDALASAISLIPKRLSLDEGHYARDAHLEYLRESGAPVSYIEQIAQQYSNGADPAGPEDFAEYFSHREFRS